MASQPIPTYFFALVVVRRGDSFLLVHERKHGQTWYFPGGRVDARESLIHGAIRETREEAGITVRITGLIRFEHLPGASASRVRVVFTGVPADDSPLKKSPDRDSLGAEWVGLGDLSRYGLRGDEVRELMEYVLKGGATYPLSVLEREGAPYHVK